MPRDYPHTQIVHKSFQFCLAERLYVLSISAIKPLDSLLPTRKHTPVSSSQSPPVFA